MFSLRPSVVTLKLWIGLLFFFVSFVWHCDCVGTGQCVTYFSCNCDDNGCGSCPTYHTCAPGTWSDGSHCLGTNCFPIPENLGTCISGYSACNCDDNGCGRCLNYEDCAPGKFGFGVKDCQNGCEDCPPFYTSHAKKSVCFPKPTSQPSSQPSSDPSRFPTSLPSLQPSQQPSCLPSSEPSVQPSLHPSHQPSTKPSKQPSSQPSFEPSCQPSNVPSSQPSQQPTAQPSAQPSGRPSLRPTVQPSSNPTCQPSAVPSNFPSQWPSGQPTSVPSAQPYMTPSQQPSIQPTNRPSCCPSSQPSMCPSIPKKDIKWKITTPYVYEKTIKLGALTVQVESLPSRDFPTNPDIDKCNLENPTICYYISVTVSAIDREASSNGSSKLITFQFNPRMPKTAVLPNKVPILLSPGTYSFNVEVDGPAKHQYNSPINRSKWGRTDLRILRTDEYIPAPKFRNAAFNDDGSGLVFEFDSPTNVGEGNMSFPCSDLFDFKCVARSSCRWIDSSTVVVSLDDINCIKLEDPVTFLGQNNSKGLLIKAPRPDNTNPLMQNAIQFYDYWSASEKWTVHITPPESGTYPVVSLLGPSQLQNCMDLVIDYSSSVGNGRRPWRSAKISLIDYQNFIIYSANSFSSLKSYLSSLDSHQSNRLIFSIEASLLLPNVSYVFAVELCNYVSNACGTANKTVTIVKSASTNLAISALIFGPSIFNMTRDSAISLTAVAEVVSCNKKLVVDESALTFQWFVSKLNHGLFQHDATYKSESTDPTRFKLSPYRLDTESTYKIGVAVHGAGFKSGLSEVVVNVVPSPLVARFRGGSGSKIIRQSDVITLDATTSFDPDISPNSSSTLRYFWICRQFYPTAYDHCHNMFQIVELPYSTNPSSLVLNPIDGITDVVSNASAVVTLTITDGDKSDRAELADILLTLVPKSSPRLSIALADRAKKINPNFRVMLEANLSVSDGSSGNCSWKLNPESGYDIQMLSLVPTTVAVKASSFLTLAIARNSFAFGSKLFFSLGCYFVDGSSVLVSLETVVNEVPSSGTFLVTPSVGLELKQLFDFKAIDWFDPDLPLQYDFGYRSWNNGPRWVIQSRSFALRGTSTLPAFVVVESPDSYPYPHDALTNCSVSVYDALDANIESYYGVKVISDARNGNNTRGLGSLTLDLDKALSSKRLDGIKQQISAVLSTLNKVNCSLAPLCSRLGRSPCSTIAHTCGDCLSSDLVSLTGFNGNSNVPCLERAVFMSLVQKSLSEQSCGAENDRTCAFPLECRHDKCEVPNKKCIGDCSFHGSCLFVKSDSKSIASSCAITASDCQAVCNCSVGFHGTSCSMTSDDLAMRQHLREKTLEGLQHLMNSDDDHSSMEGWISTLSGISTKYDEFENKTLAVLGNITVELLHRLHSSDPLKKNGFLDKHVDILGDVIDNIAKSKTVLMGNSTSQGGLTPELLDHLNTLNEFVASSMVAGEKTVVVMGDSFKSLVSAFNAFDFLLEKNISLDVPQTSVERAMKKLSTVSVPMHVTTAESTQPISLRVVSLDPLYSYPNSGFISNPIFVDLSKPALVSQRRMLSERELSTSEIIVRLQHNQPIRNYRFINSEAAVTIIEVCHSNVVETRTRYCKDDHLGVTPIHIYCNGSANVVYKRCPYSTPVSVCDTMATNASSSLNSWRCQKVEDLSSATLTTCSCLITFTASDDGFKSSSRRLADQATDSFFEVKSSGNIVNTISYLFEQTSSTVVSIQYLSANSVRRTWEVLVLQSILIFLVILGVIFGILLDISEKRKIQLKALIGRLRGNGKSEPLPMIATRRRKSDQIVKEMRFAVRTPKKSLELSLLDECLPAVFQSQSFSQKVVYEMKRYHRYLGIVYFYSEPIPRPMRMLSLSTSITCMMFLQAFTFSVRNTNDGICQKFITEDDCINKGGPSPLFSGDSKCIWGFDDPNSCSPRQPNIMEILIVATFAAVVTAPLVLFADWVVMKILVPPSIKVAPAEEDPENASKHSKRSDEAQDGDYDNAIDRDAALVVKLRFDRDLITLSEGIAKHRKNLGMKELMEFDDAWGLNQEPSWFNCFGLRSNSTGNQIDSIDANRFTNSVSTKESCKDNNDLSHKISSGSSISLVQKKKDAFFIADHLPNSILSNLRTVGDETVSAMPLLRANAASPQFIGKTLLFYFQRDLMPSVCSAIVNSKHNRDSEVPKPVSWHLKVLGWLAIIGINVMMMLYLFLFAVNESHDNQMAWMKAFLLWLAMDIFVVSTAMVMLTHVILPSLIHRDVQKTKENIVDLLVKLRIEAKKNEKKRETIMNGHTSKAISRMKSEMASTESFNAAPSLLLCYRLASKFPTNPISKLILAFRTTLPPRALVLESKSNTKQIAQLYSRKMMIVSSTISMVGLLILQSVLNLPYGIQDFLANEFLTIVLASSASLVLMVYSIHPALLLAPIIGSAFVIHFAIMAIGKSDNRLNPKIAPMPSMSDDDANSSETDKAATRPRDGPYTSGLSPMEVLSLPMPRRASLAVGKVSTEDIANDLIAGSVLPSLSGTNHDSRNSDAEHRDTSGDIFYKNIADWIKRGPSAGDLMIVTEDRDDNEIDDDDVFDEDSIANSPPGRVGRANSEDGKSQVPFLVKAKMDSSYYDNDVGISWMSFTRPVVNSDSSSSSSSPSVYALVTKAVAKVASESSFGLSDDGDGNSNGVEAISPIIIDNKSDSTESHIEELKRPLPLRRQSTDVVFYDSDEGSNIDTATLIGNHTSPHEMNENGDNSSGRERDEDSEWDKLDD